MKKFKKILLITIVLLAAGSLTTLGIVNTIKQNELDKHLILIDYEEFKEKIENKESFILLISMSTCSHCKEFKPTLKQVLKDNNLYAYEVQTDRFKNQGKEAVAYLNSIASTSGTPTTTFIENGQETNTINRLVGIYTKAEVENQFKKMGYIK